ncbi:MAG: hypothetical protein ACU0B7_07300 [Paracoccaceae bacterium]
MGIRYKPAREDIFSATVQEGGRFREELHLVPTYTDEKCKARESLLYQEHKAVVGCIKAKLPLSEEKPQNRGRNGRLDSAGYSNGLQPADCLPRASKAKDIHFQKAKPTFRNGQSDDFAGIFLML